MDDEVIRVFIKTASEADDSPSVIELEEEFIIPILRRLSDMTEEDYNYCLRSSVGKEIAYLLSKSFDLFGWIDDGLAIDRETLKGNLKATTTKTWEKVGQKNPGGRQISGDMEEITDRQVREYFLRRMELGWSGNEFVVTVGVTRVDDRSLLSVQVQTSSEREQQLQHLRELGAVVRRMDAHLRAQEVMNDLTLEQVRALSGGTGQLSAEEVRAHKQLRRFDHVGDESV